MKKLMSLLLVLGLAFALTPAQAKDAAATCAAQAAEKKLAGAAKASYEKKCLADAGGQPAAAASPACEKSAADKKLHGAAKNAHVKKCMADEQAAGGGKK